MMLSRFTLKHIVPGVVKVPDEQLFELPEKVLQFGTGVLLRGLADHYIDKANRKGIFNGRIVVVKSTSQGGADTFEKQDALYTLCIRGMKSNQTIAENYINAAISRVLHAQRDWEQILSCAHDQGMQVIISNTTEVGIQLVNDDIRRHPPVSYPGKLLAFLYERFKAFGGSVHSGMVIVPTELVPDNGKKLEAIVLELAHLNGLPEEFMEWLEKYNYFCNSLVDRIVPGSPEPSQQALLEKEFGYTDALLSIAEAYSLWAIEGDENIRRILSFAEANEEVVIMPDIDLHRELKLRLLNGSHTLSCGVAFLSGFETVKEAMDEPAFAGYISNLLLHELANGIPYPVEPQVAEQFGQSVLDRFRNPYIRHYWKSITMQYSTKMKMRCLPILLEYYERHGRLPELFAKGFAAWLYFMRVREKDGRYYGELNGQPYEVTDDMSAVFSKRWEELTPSELVFTTLADRSFWKHDLSLLPGWQDLVLQQLEEIMQQGMQLKPSKKRVIN
ncbi:tagaturonate reductase [Chitinophaga niabensis]|uniref:tagaturonate reductase n=1 Tax=Chitinophaga niabensis TaxID=536979 RepID=UPI0031B9E6FA